MLKNIRGLRDKREGGVKQGLSLTKKETLRDSRQFKNIYTWGRRCKGPHLAIVFMPNQLRSNRLGFSVAKKRFKLSTRRNYIRRRLREAYRLNKMRFAAGYDIVITALSYPKDKVPLGQITAELLSLAQKTGLLKR